MLHLETIEPHTLELLHKIQTLPEFAYTRLVGGTALALQIGHRKSIDLDLFGNELIAPEDLYAALKSISDNVQLISTTRTMRFFFVNGIKVDFICYPYLWITPEINENGLHLASIEDIAAMKLSAITNRGTKNDFIDLYFLLEHYPMNELLRLYQEKYPGSTLFATLKSLTYFDDAENDPMPVMLRTVDWESVKERILSVLL